MASVGLTIELAELIETSLAELTEFGESVLQSSTTSALADGLGGVAETSFIEGENAAFLSSSVYGVGTSEQAGELIATETLDAAEQSVLEEQNIQETIATAEQDVAVETASERATVTAPAQIEITETAPAEIEMQEFLPSPQQLGDILEEDEETIFINDKRTSTPELITSPRRTRTDTFARQFFRRNSLITRPLRTLRGTTRSRFVYEEIPSDIEMNDIVLQDKQIQQLKESSFIEDVQTVPKRPGGLIDTSETVPKRVSFADELDVETIPEDRFVSVDLDESGTEFNDAFRNELPIEEEDIPTFIQNIPRRLTRPIRDALKRYARRFGLTLKQHKYFVILLSAFTGLSMAYIWRKKRSTMITTIPLITTPSKDKETEDNISDTKHVIQGIKDFAKVITSHVPDVEQHSKQILNKPKLKKNDILQALNHLEQKAYENMIKKN